MFWCLLLLVICVSQMKVSAQNGQCITSGTCDITCCPSTLTTWAAQHGAYPNSLATIYAPDNTLTWPILPSSMQLYAGYCFNERLACGYAAQITASGVTIGPVAEAEVWMVIQGTNVFQSSSSILAGMSPISISNTNLFPGQVVTPPRIMCIGAPDVTDSLGNFLGNVGGSCVFEASGDAHLCNGHGNPFLSPVFQKGVAHGGGTVESPPYWCLATTVLGVDSASPAGTCNRYNGNYDSCDALAGGAIQFLGGISQPDQFTFSGGKYSWTGARLGYDCEFTGSCACEPDWFGPYCNISITAFCGPNGNCNGHGQCGSSTLSAFFINPICADFIQLIQCTCNPGYFGQFCDVTCLLDGNTNDPITCPAESTCVANGLLVATVDIYGNFYAGSDNCNNISPPGACCEVDIGQGYSALTEVYTFATPNSAKCLCATNWFPILDNFGSATSCITCMDNGQAIPTCNNNGACVNVPSVGPNAYACICNPGYGGIGCNVVISLTVTCGNQNLAIDCLAMQSATALSAVNIRYQCAYRGTLVTSAPLLAGAQFPIEFVCSNVNLYDNSGTPTLNTNAGMCQAIKQVCESTLTEVPVQSEDLCPIPFIDLVPPTDPAAFCDYPFTGNPQPPIPQYLIGNYYPQRTFYCYRLSSALLNIPSVSSGLTPYRCVNSPTEINYYLLCDVSLNTTQTATFKSEPMQLGKLLLQTCTTVSQPTR